MSSLMFVFILMDPVCKPSQYMLILLFSDDLLDLSSCPSSSSFLSIFCCCFLSLRIRKYLPISSFTSYFSGRHSRNTYVSRGNTLARRTRIHRFLKSVAVIPSE